MPATQRKLTAFSLSRKPLKPLQGRNGQRKLHDLKKVVSIRGGAVNFDSSELVSAKAILQSKESSADDLLESLRRLSCFQITREMLVNTHVGGAVRLLKQHSDAEVARVAATLVEKWKQVVVAERH